jgi:phenylacetic acid degradation protein paaN
VTTSPKTLPTMSTRHRQRLDDVQRAVRDRGAWSPYPEQAQKLPNYTVRQRHAQGEFQLLLGRAFPDDVVDGSARRLGGSTAVELSPYTRQPLGIAYPRAALDDVMQSAAAAVPSWAAADVGTRLGVLLDAMDLHEDALLLLALSVQHTTGQSPAMAWAGSGVNALDRGLEALAMAETALTLTPTTAVWRRRFGKDDIILDKTYRLVPRGVAACFACATFPTWNAWPSMLASLATGNAVVVKPHPTAILPMALSVGLFRRALDKRGHDANLVQLLVDTPDAPIGKALVQHPLTALVDFTGGAAFGEWVEEHAGKRPCFTETAGLNSVVLDSCDDLDAVLAALATTLSLFSAQMCTSPQNLYLPETGVRVGQGDSVVTVSAAEVETRLVAQLNALAENPKRAASVCAAIQSDATLALLERLTTTLPPGARVLRPATPYAHPEHPNARTATPLVITCRADDEAHGALYREERFGPVCFVIRCANRDDALMQLERDVSAHGGLTAFLWSTDEAFVARAFDATCRAGAQLTVNLVGAMPLNFAAAYSDFHVTGKNAAGTATLTDLAFVASRFHTVQMRQMRTATSTSPQEASS